MPQPKQAIEERSRAVQEHALDNHDFCFDCVHNAFHLSRDMISLDAESGDSSTNGRLEAELDGTVIRLSLQTELRPKAQ